MAGTWKQLCCSLKNSVISAVKNFDAEEREIDDILLNTTGLANAHMVASVFWVDAELRSDISLDGMQWEFKIWINTFRRRKI